MGEGMKRRTFVKALGAGFAGAGMGLLPSWARSANAPELAVAASQPRSRYDITIGRSPISVGGVERSAMTFNGTVSGPLIHLREGDEVTLNVTNTLDEDTSVHWRGRRLLWQFRDRVRRASNPAPDHAAPL
jgi:FtsP/CotA-like multicopper oxidase with cupredoxin domain